MELIHDTNTNDSKLINIYLLYQTVKLAGGDPYWVPMHLSQEGIRRTDKKWMIVCGHHKWKYTPIREQPMIDLDKCNLDPEFDPNEVAIPNSDAADCETEHKLNDHSVETIVESDGGYESDFSSTIYSMSPRNFDELLDQPHSELEDIVI
jgi:hypothetical protein